MNKTRTVVNRAFTRSTQVFSVLTNNVIEFGWGGGGGGVVKKNTNQFITA